MDQLKKKKKERKWSAYIKMNERKKIETKNERTKR